MPPKKCPHKVQEAHLRRERNRRYYNKRKETGIPYSPNIRSRQAEIASPEAENLLTLLVLLTFSLFLMIRHPSTAIPIFLTWSYFPQF